MVKQVLPLGDPILTTPCAPVKNVSEIQSVIQDLWDTVAALKTQHDFRRGIGLAAPQIGVLQRVSVIETAEQEQLVLINPEIIAHADERKSIREGCISFLEYRAMVPRFVWVKVRAINSQGDVFEIEGEADFAMLLQHEIDHLSGILYLDHLAHGKGDLINIHAS